jgi:hypothetical protein
VSGHIFFENSLKFFFIPMHKFVHYFYFTRAGLLLAGPFVLCYARRTSKSLMWGSGEVAMDIQGLSLSLLPPISPAAAAGKPLLVDSS